MLSLKKFIAFFIGLDFLALFYTLIVPTYNPTREIDLLTFLSFFQLMIIATISWDIFRKRKSTTISIKSGFMFWAFLSLGFFYLSMDEIIMMRNDICEFFGNIFVDAHLSTCLSDFVIVAYGAVAFLLMLIYRDEVKKFNSVTPLFVCGFLLMMIMVLLNVLYKTNLISELFSNLDAGIEFNQRIGNFIRIFEIVIETVFVAIIYSCNQISQKI